MTNERDYVKERGGRVNYTDWVRKIVKFPADSEHNIRLGMLTKNINGMMHDSLRIMELLAGNTTDEPLTKENRDWLAAMLNETMDDMREASAYHQEIFNDAYENYKTVGGVIIDPKRVDLDRILAEAAAERERAGGSN